MKYNKDFWEKKFEQELDWDFNDEETNKIGKIVGIIGVPMYILVTPISVAVAAARDFVGCVEMAIGLAHFGKACGKRLKEGKDYAKPVKNDFPD